MARAHPVRRLRTLLASVAVCAVLVWVWMSIPPHRLSLWVGNAQLCVSFVAVDSRTGTPVANALVRCLDPDVPERGPIHSATTDDLGRAVIVEGLQIYGWKSSFSGGQSVHYPQWEFQVSCDGYETSELISLTDRIGFGGDPTRGALHPAVITVLLERARAATGPGGAPADARREHGRKREMEERISPRKNPR
jgi:hypothetical protein